MSETLPAVILAGGLGTRIREETEFKPKPMVEIGGRPVLWHIMKHLSFYGIDRFIICVGYKGDIIRDYFLNYRARNNDFTVSLGLKNELKLHSDHQESNWSVTVAETGALTNTGGRVLGIQKYVAGENFLCTYGDGLADINLKELMDFHLAHGKKATVTTVQPLSRFGVMDVDSNGVVTQFREKPIMDGWVNAGFFIFEKSIVEYLEDNCILEQEPLAKLAAEGELVA